MWLVNEKWIFQDNKTTRKAPSAGIFALLDGDCPFRKCPSLSLLFATRESLFVCAVVLRPGSDTRN